VDICAQGPKRNARYLGHVIGALCYLFDMAWNSPHGSVAPLVEVWGASMPGHVEDRADDQLCGVWRRLKETGQADPRRLATLDPDDEGDLVSMLGQLLGREVQWHVDASRVRWLRQLILDSTSGAVFLHSQVTRNLLSWLPVQVCRGSVKRRREEDSQRVRREDLVPPKPSSMRWPTSLERRLASTVGPKARQDLEEKEKGKWARRLHSLVVSACLPTSQRLGLLNSDDEIRRKCARGIRASTLRSRVRAAEKISKWSQLSKGVDWLRDEEDFENYLTDLLLENRARSVFEEARLGFMMVETVGGVPESSQLSRKATIKALVKDLITERSKGVMKEKKQAPQLPAIFVLKLETMIGDLSVPVFKRGYAFLKLVALWTGLRSDDQTWIVPQSMVLGEFGLEFALRQTKTTGPDKKIQVLRAFVSRGAWVHNRDWLATGLGIWEVADPNRDAFVLLPESGLEGFSDRAASYLDMAAMTRALVLDFEHDSSDDIEEEVLGPLLATTAAATFWTEHSWRATFATWASALQVPKEVYEMIGRWKAESGDSASGYVRTMRRQVGRAQDLVAKVIQSSWRHGRVPDLFYEGDMLFTLDRFLKEREVDEVKRVSTLERLRLFYSRTLDLDEALQTYGWMSAPFRQGVREHGEVVVEAKSSEEPSAPLLPVEDVEVEDGWIRLGGVATPPSVWTLLVEGEPVEYTRLTEAEALEDSVVLQELKVAAEVEEAVLQVGGDEPSLGPLDYVVSVTAKQKMRRLHRVGWCWRVPGLDYRSFRALPGEPGASDFDLCCKDCWRSGLRVESRSELVGGESSQLLSATGSEVDLQVVLRDDLERDVNETSSSSSGDEEGFLQDAEKDGAEKNSDEET
jgi:hypothetical protein